MIPRKMWVYTENQRQPGFANLKLSSSDCFVSEALEHILICFRYLEKNAKLLNFLFDNFASSIDQDGMYLDFNCHAF